jgi:hypothetical protein
MTLSRLFFLQYGVSLPLKSQIVARTASKARFGEIVGATEGPRPAREMGMLSHHRSSVCMTTLTTSTLVAEITNSYITRLHHKAVSPGTLMLQPRKHPAFSLHIHFSSRSAYHTHLSGHSIIQPQLARMGFKQTPRGNDTIF